jgi:hypothetical protein
VKYRVLRFYGWFSGSECQGETNRVLLIAYRENCRDRTRGVITGCRLITEVKHEKR